MTRFRRPSPAMVVASLALAVSLGGTGIAANIALAPNSVGTAQLKNNAVTGVKVTNGTLLKADFKAGQILAGATGPPGPAGTAGSAGPSDAYARFLHGPIVVASPGFATLASLTIPQAGKYVLWAKAYFSQANITGTPYVLCRLTIAPDIEQSVASLSANTVSNLTTMVVHEFPTAGSAEFQCAATSTTMTANFVKITAIRVGTLANSG